MALKRNGNGKTCHKVKKDTNGYERNGNGVPDIPDYEQQPLVYKHNVRSLSRGTLRALEVEDNRVVAWLKKITETNLYSREWLLMCLEEISLQCMGKRLRARGDMHVLDYTPKTAINALKLMAEIQGFNMWKLNRDGVLSPAVPVNQENVPEVKKRTKQIGLEDMSKFDDRAAEKLINILNEGGAFDQSSPIECTDVEVIE